MSTPQTELARIVERSGLTVAIAESMTAGELATAIVDIDGSGEWFRGGIVAYDADAKYEILDVTRGPVICASAAEEMAAGVAALFDADIGIATTGCAGPEPMEGQPVGTLWIGVSVARTQTHRHVITRGASPSERRAESVATACEEAGTRVRRFLATRERGGRAGAIAE
jgi:PncC family amidohydrolase